MFLHLRSFLHDESSVSCMQGGYNENEDKDSALALRSADSGGGIYNFWKVMCKLLLRQKQLHYTAKHNISSVSMLTQRLQETWSDDEGDFMSSWAHQLEPDLLQKKRQWWAVRHVALRPCTCFSDTITVKCLWAGVTLFVMLSALLYFNTKRITCRCPH